MKALKTLVAIALSAGGLGTAVTLGAVSVEHSDNNAQVAEASVTNGKYRINVLTNSANWLQDGVSTIFNPAGTNVSMSKVSDFDQSSTNSNYSSVKIGNTTYNLQSYELSAKTGITKNETYWFGRGNANTNSNWFDSGINLYNQFRSHDYDNTIIISGSWDNFSASAYGWYVKVALHTGLNLETTSYLFMNSGTTPTTPDIGNKLFVGWYTDSDLTQKWTSGGQYTDINLYAKYAESEYYLVGDSAFVSEIGSAGSAWAISGGYLMENVYGGTNKAEVAYTFEQTVQLKAKSVIRGVESWIDVGGSTGTGISVVSGNYQLTAGTYSFYIGGDNKLYIAVGLQLDAYCTEFLDQTGQVCDGEDTVEADLLVKWNKLATDYTKMSSEDQTTLAGTVGNESGTDAQKVMARYDVIIKNHTSFNDFMNRKNNANYTYKSAFMKQNINHNDILPIILVASSIILVATGAFFLLRKKRKEQ